MKIFCCSYLILICIFKSEISLDYRWPCFLIIWREIHVSMAAGFLDEIRFQMGG